MKRSLPLVLWLLAMLPTPCYSADREDWIELFDGESLRGWKASEHAESFRVEEGTIVCQGERSHLFYVGPVHDHDFRNFELEVEVKLAESTNSGIYIHTAYQEEGWPGKGYEIQLNTSFEGVGNYRELKRTGSLYGVRNVYRKFIPDNRWFTVKIEVIENRIRIWVDGIQTVDYVELEKALKKPNREGRRLASGTIALQGHDPGSRAAFRSVRIRPLPDAMMPALSPIVAENLPWIITPAVDPYNPTRMLDFNQQREALESFVLQMDGMMKQSIPVIDYHVHLRGGMTTQLAMERQAKTGINIGVVRNIGRGWPIETDRQLEEYLDATEGLPLFIGVQVNDRDWMKQFDADLLERLDFVLADTMIMPDRSGKPVRLWMEDQVEIDDAQEWMDRYIAHNLRVLSEPVDIVANPTYLPAILMDRYDELWTEGRMQTVIDAAVENDVALEINVKSGFPSRRFLEMAKKAGAKFTFGSNNHDDLPTDMHRCFLEIGELELKKNDMFVPKQ
jgi:hypothetical protein